MSHVVKIDVQITDLDALADACSHLGLELVRDQKTYRWYGTHVGDFPMPVGFSAADLGKCDHAIRVAGKPDAYEIGLVARRDGQPGYTLLFDFWDGGEGLMALVSKDGSAHGKDCTKLAHEYAAAKAVRKARFLGYRHEVKRTATGMVQSLRFFK